jgi:hypothetical protein
MVFPPRIIQAALTGIQYALYVNSKVHTLHKWKRNSDLMLADSQGSTDAPRTLVYEVRSRHVEG